MNCSTPSPIGIGLRFPHHKAVANSRPQIGWLEVHPENYMLGGALTNYLDDLRCDYPISLHGVGLSIGSADELDRTHLEQLSQLVDRLEPFLISEHLSWCSAGQTYLSELLPLPMTEEALDVVCCHVDQMQARLNRQILLENPSNYLEFRHSTISEWNFLESVVSRTGCGILCDINNLYVSAENLGWNTQRYLNALPSAAIGEIHLGGHSQLQFDSGGKLLIDDHGSRISPDVWALYAHALTRFGDIPTLIEWDTNVPPLEVLLDEASKADQRLRQRLGGSDHADVK
jgi:uncharacterized protein (UPF0276 family)